MAVAHTTVLELLGKQVSFIHSIQIGLDAYPMSITGTVTEIILSLNDDHLISIDKGDFYPFSELRDFQISYS